MSKRLTDYDVFVATFTNEEIISFGGEATGTDVAYKGEPIEKLWRIEEMCYDHHGNELITLADLAELCAAKRDGRLVVLPCKVGDTVYTFDEDYLNCGECPFGAESFTDRFGKNHGCQNEERLCPLITHKHVVHGFDIGRTKELVPGTWGYEGLESYAGRDGNWYRTMEEVEAAKERFASDHAALSAGKGE